MTVKASATITLSRVNDGAPGRTYFIEASSNVLKRSKDNTMSPNFIEFKAYYRDGNSATRTPYAGRFVVEETADGNTWRTIYTSNTDENAVRHQLYSLLSTQNGQIIATENGSVIGIPRGVTSVRCKLYASGGTTNLMDMQSVAVVVDVDNLTQKDVFNSLTNNGEWQGIFSDGAGNYFFNGTFMKVGRIESRNGRVYFDLDNNEIVCSKLKASRPWDYTTGTDPGDVVVDISKKSIYNKYYSYVNIYKDGFEEKGVKIEPLKSGGCKIFSEIIDILYSTSGTGYSEESSGVKIDKKQIVISAKADDGLDAVLWVGGTTSDIYIPRTLSVGEKITANSLSVTGAKKRIVKTNNYDIRSLYCYEMPSPMFGDIGEATTDNSGICYIYLDDIFQETVNANVEYQVFLQKEGQGDIWIDSKYSTYFVVKGTPNLKFSWEIKVKQRDFELYRLEDNETTEYNTENINYEKIGQKLFEEYLNEKENSYESSN